MVSRALSTQSNSTSPSRTSASAECSSCVRPRKLRNCSAASARSAGLLKRVAAARQRLVGAQHQPSGQRAPPLRSALARASKRRRGGGIGGAGFGFDRAFVDLRRPDLEAQAGRRQHLAAHVAFRCEHQRLRAASQSGMILASTGWRRRSLNSLITAAAVSSIERRVTSIDGQLFLAQSRRENATSSATAVLSIY